MTAANAGMLAAVAVMNAIRSMGVVVQVEPADFVKLVERQSEPLVVYAPPKLFAPKHEYVVSYKGLAFYTKSREELRLPGTTEIIRTKSMSVPF
jgi:hypothetical protein